MSRCSSCAAPIMWAKVTRSGARIPIDADPVAGGNVRVVAGDRVEVLTKAEAEAAERAGVPLHVSHFATCPDAREHRKPKR